VPVGLLSRKVSTLQVLGCQLKGGEEIGVVSALEVGEAHDFKKLSFGVPFLVFNGKRHIIPEVTSEGVSQLLDLQCLLLGDGGLRLLDLNVLRLLQSVQSLQVIHVSKVLETKLLKHELSHVLTVIILVNRRLFDQDLLFELRFTLVLISV